MRHGPWRLAGGPRRSSGSMVRRLLEARALRVGFTTILLGRERGRDFAADVMAAVRLFAKRCAAHARPAPRLCPTVAANQFVTSLPDARAALRATRIPGAIVGFWLGVESRIRRWVFREVPEPRRALLPGV